MLQLKQKHPEAQEAKVEAILHGPAEETVRESIYIGINKEMIREARRTKESGGPSGIDANGFKGILACKSFKHPFKGFVYNT